MKEKIKSILNSDRFVIFIGLIIVPMTSFTLIAIGDESPLYTSISRLAWVNGYWIATFIWAAVVMGSVAWLTYKMVFTGPFGDRGKRVFFYLQLLNIILVFIGCIIFPAKPGEDALKFAHYVHDYLTIAAWAMYGIGLLVYSIIMRKHDKFLSFLGVCLMSFVIFSSMFFITQVIDPDTYVGASAVSEVYIINSLFMYLITMYISQRIKLSETELD